MLRVIYYALAYAALLMLTKQLKAEERAEKLQEQSASHPWISVDTKYWIRDTEFNERDNWQDSRKPCTLLERININEQSVISMGNSLDTLSSILDSNIKELILQQNSLILLEEDSLEDPADPMFIQYLNQSGDCFDSESYFDKPENEQVFQFAPDPDSMSWFNPSNWASYLNSDEYIHLPESHSIPCTEDVVVFGSRLLNFEQTLASSERASTLSFKVNFRASQYSDLADINNNSITNLRVAELKIGNQSYNQQEFEQLVNSDKYRNILFDFDGRQSEGGDELSQPALVIDESSIQKLADYNLCIEEAGCICGNEDANIMKSICSFNLPIDPIQLPCHDPIYSTGYCNKICALVISISMDPTKFSERYISTLINSVVAEQSRLRSEIDDTRFVGRRISNNKYEITLRQLPSSEVDSGSAYSIHESLIDELTKRLNNGKLNLALINTRWLHYHLNLIVKHSANLKLNYLTTGALRSFYGIKSINIKSSSKWRHNNREYLFWVSFALLSLAATALLMRDENTNSRSRTNLVSTDDNISECLDQLVEDVEAKSEASISVELLSMVDSSPK